jgi:hypothetical protein
MAVWTAFGLAGILRRDQPGKRRRLHRLGKRFAFPTFPPLRRLREINPNRTFHLLTKPEILTCYEQPIREHRNGEFGWLIITLHRVDGSLGGLSKCGMPTREYEWRFEIKREGFR